MRIGSLGSGRGLGPRRRGIWPVCVLTVGLVSSEILSNWRLRSEPPDDRQSIAAMLVSWGLDPKNVAARPDDGETARWVAKLDSPDSVERVRASWWLGARGVCSAGPAIAAALTDVGTGRPCQLAHQLGRLGDDRWVPLLLDAAGQRSNTDLQVCALLALGELASVRATDGLIRLYRQDATAMSALSALGEIADPQSADFLRTVAARPRSDDERRLAAQALERIGILIARDPVPALIHLATAESGSRRVNVWAVRQLVILGDSRAVAALAASLAQPDLFQEHRIMLAAALTTFGRPGTAALRSAAFPEEAQSVVIAARSFCRDVGPAVRVGSF